MAPRTTMLRGFTGLLLLTLITLTTACGGAEARKERYLAKGEALMAEGNYEKARLEFRNAVQIDPKDAMARVRAGEAAERLGNYSEAAQMYQSAVAAMDRTFKRAFLSRRERGPHALVARRRWAGTCVR